MMTNVTRTGTRRGQPHAVLAIALASLAWGCGGGGGGGGADGGGGGFTPASPPADVCGLLTLADVQAAMPGAVAGVEEQTPNTADLGFWSRICHYDDAVVTSRSLELVIFGGTTAKGLTSIKLAAASGKTNTPVSGLGT